MFQRIAIINRGEAAMRLINAVRELNAENPDEEPMRTIALYTDAERTAKFAREADEAYPIGPASNRPYLDHELLARTLREVRADAVWVGWGFVAEDPAFADLVDGLGITFIGPSGDVMRALGDKIGSKLLAEQAGVPMAPWSRGGVDTLDDALGAAERIGYPLMLKASAGGGGRGIRRVENARDLADAYQRTRDEAERAFGSSVVFLEKLVTGARHVEVQIIGDSHGTAWALGVRDCTVQRRNQKVIEESSSPLLAPQATADLRAAAERLATSVGYCGAGTVEFLYSPDEQAFAFLEVNTRLQVEHPITEQTTTFDLVKAQLHVAAGGALTERPVEEGHAIEARLNAEDPDRDFAPSPGRIVRLDLPAGPGVRVDTGVAEGDAIPADFDSMIAKVIASGRTRAEALGRLRRALADTTVIIEGGATNKSFLLALLERPEVVGGGEAPWADTAWIDRARAEGDLVADAHAGVALVAAAIGAYEEAENVEQQRLLDTARGGRPQVQPLGALAIDLKLRGVAYTLRTARTGPTKFTVIVGDQPVEVDVQRLDDVHTRLGIEGESYRIVTATHGPIALVEVNGVTHRISHDEGGVLRSPAPALVVATPACVGDEVEAGAPVVVLESMKMETVVSAPFAARVKQVHVRTGSQVESMAPLVRLEPVGDAQQAVSVGTVELPAASHDPSPADEVEQGLQTLSAILMGFDPDPHGGELKRYLTARARLGDVNRAVDGEIELFELFADLAELSRNRPLDEQVSTELRVHSDREHFHSYLVSLDPDRAGLSESFVDRLRRALAHYGVDSLDRSPELESAVFRIFLAEQRLAGDVDIILGLLGVWAAEPAPTGSRAGRARSRLERLVRATQLRFPEVRDLARSVRFRWFDQPLVDAEREEVLAGVPAEVADLAANPEADDYDERLNALASIPERVAGVLAQRLRSGVPQREPLLQVLLRKHYSRHGMTDVPMRETEGRSVVTGRYTLNDVATLAISTEATCDELDASGRVARVVAEALTDLGDCAGAVVELYVRYPEAPALEELGPELAGTLSAWNLPATIRRVVVGVCTDDEEVQYLTYRPGEGGLAEDVRIRRVHPMIFRRMDLWRLEHFDITRLPSPRGVLLFDCVARTHPDDRRLVAMAEVQQIAAIRDQEGRLIALPHAERAVERCLEAIRRTRASLGKAGSKLDRNHVWVHVWPVIEMELDDILPLQTKITPISDGAGIEEVLATGHFRQPDGSVRDLGVRFQSKPGTGVSASVGRPPREPLQPLDDYASKVMRATRRGLAYPYELTDTLAGPGGSLIELDLAPVEPGERDRLVEVDRRPGLNRAGVIVAKVTTRTALHPQGITRIALSGDPTKGLGAVAEAECRRIIAALDLAEELGVPLEWFTISSGARISMTSGVENMDWVGAALRRIVEFTQAGGEINIVVAGINVGAQPYWNAEATMLMHTKGVLIMTPDSAMVLTGKQSLDFSGGVSAEDNFGIGGYDRVMGPNGQAQYWAPNLKAAFGILLTHYDQTYVAPGEAGPRRATTTDPVERDVSSYPHVLAGSDFHTVGDIFSHDRNPDRKKAFDIRTVLASVCDQDHDRTERWANMADAETAVVMDARLGGHSVSLIGVESKAVPRAGFPPTDGPDTYTSGTLFPRSSKKVARAINAASGNRPIVVLANLSGFDGSPESMRNLQLEYGAEIARAIVNFDGPIVFCVISRYHGGAFVVFSKTLNENLTVLAVEGSFASVIGGAPAAAVVFAGDVAQRTAQDPRVTDLEERLRAADAEDRAALQHELTETKAEVRAEKISEIAAEFDGIHSIHRAVEVGAVDRVIQPHELRPALIEVLDAKLAQADR